MSDKKGIGKLLDVAKSFNPLEQGKEAIVDVAKEGLSKAADIVKNVQEGKMQVAEGLQEIERLKIESESKLKIALESNITSRWRLDSNSDSIWSKTARPFTLYFTIINTFALMWVTVLTNLKIDESWIPLLITIVSTVLGGYFVLRTIEKKR